MTAQPYQQPKDQTMINLRPMIHWIALGLAQQALREQGLNDTAEAAKAYLAATPGLLRQAELQLRRAPGIRKLAAQWRADRESELAQSRADKLRSSR
jgi:hypothetical protein